MKAKELIELLQRVDGDTQIAICGEGGLTRTITLWDWTDTNDVVVLVAVHGGIDMTHDLTWAERVKSEYKELLKKVARLDLFLDSNPTIDEGDILLLKAQRDAMRTYATILLMRLHHHNLDLDVTEEYLYNE